MGPLFPLYFPDSFTPGQLVKFGSEKKTMETDHLIEAIKQKS